MSLQNFQIHPAERIAILILFVLKLPFFLVTIDTIFQSETHLSIQPGLTCLVLI